MGASESDKQERLVRFGAKLRQLRGDISQRQLAQELGSSKSELSRIEQGVKLPSQQLCRQYEKFFRLGAGAIRDERNVLEKGEWDETPVLLREVEGQSSHSASGEEGYRSTTERKTIGLIFILSVAVLIATWVMMGLARRGMPYPDLRDCLRVGTLNTELASDPNAKGVPSRLRAAYRQAGGKIIGCPSAEARRWQSLIVQEIMRDRVPNGAVLVSPNGFDLYFNRAQWGSYHQFGGKTGGMAQTAGGMPVRIVNYPDGHVEIELSTGTILVAERADAPYFGILRDYVQWWRDHPALGLPTSNPLAETLHQEFQHGVGAVTPAQPTTPLFTIIEHPESELPPLKEILGRVLTHVDATTWLVTQDGKRLWIPDEETWRCLGGDDKRINGNLPGYAIATLPFAGQAQCPR